MPNTLRGRPAATRVTTDCHRPRRRPRNLSVPPDRLFKTMARPPRGDRSTPGTRRGFETSVASPRENGVVQLVVGSAGGPHRCPRGSDLASSPESRGPIPRQRGPGRCRNEATRGHAHRVTPQGNKPRQTRSPWRAPVRPIAPHAGPVVASVSPHGVVLLFDDSALSLLSHQPFRSRRSTTPTRPSFPPKRFWVSPLTCRCPRPRRSHAIHLLLSKGVFVSPPHIHNR